MHNSFDYGTGVVPLAGEIIRPVLTVLLCVVLLLPAGCGGKGAQKPLARQMKIAVALADMQRDGNQTVRQVMEKRAREENVRITWLDAGNDPGEQEKQLSGLGRKKIKAVVLQTVDPAAAPRLVQQLVRQNIKVVALESLPADTPVDAYVASDHTRAGQLQARFIIEALNQAAGTTSGPRPPAASGPGGGGGQFGGGKGGAGGGSGGQEGGGKSSSGGSGGQGGGGAAGGAQITSPGAQLPARRPVNVLILQGDPRDPAAQEIAGAAKAALAGEPRARVVGEAAQPSGDPRQAGMAVQDALRARDNQIDAVLAVDSRLAMAAVEVLKAAGLNNRVLTVGVGADKQAAQALSSGEHDAEVDTRPDLLGQYALDAAVGLAKTGHWQYDNRVSSGDYSVPARIVPVRLIQSANAYLLQQRGGESRGGGQGQGGGGGSSQSGGGGSSDAGGEKGPGGDQAGGQSAGGKQKPTTTLRITTRDGKTVEVHIKGEVKSIESMEGGGSGGGASAGGDEGGGGGGARSGGGAGP